MGSIRLAKPRRAAGDVDGVGAGEGPQVCTWKGDPYSKLVDPQPTPTLGVKLWQNLGAF